MALYECPICKFAAVDGEAVRTSGGAVLKIFTDSKGVKHEPIKASVADV